MASSSSNNAAPLRPALLQKKKSREDVLRVDPETPARRVSFSIGKLIDWISVFS